MSKFIGRRFNIGLGKESTRGTAVVASYWYPKMDFSVEDQVDTVIDNSGIGVIEDSNSSDIVKKYSEGNIAGRITDTGFGLILMAVFGTDNKTTTAGESTVYDHTFSMLQSSQHPSLTIAVVEPNSTGLRYPLAMVESLQITAEINKYAMYKVGFRANTPSATANTASFTAENTFLPQHGTVKISPTLTSILGTLTATGTAASTVNVTALSISTTLIQVGMTVTGTNVPAGATVAAIVSATAFTLSAATTGAMGTITFGVPAINIRKFDMTINKNIEDDQTLGNIGAVDRYNNQVSVDGSFEIIYDDRSYIDTMMLGDLAKAIRITLSNSDVSLGVVPSRPTLQFDLYKVKLQDVARNNKNDDVFIQTIKFKAFYSTTDSAMIACLLRNLLSTAY